MLTTRALPSACTIIPPYLLTRIASAGPPELAALARRTLELDRLLRRG
jgi:hypothetical protein